VADPEQIYQEVLQAEQAKGSSGPVAEGRAKAARARAEAGSPHPTEPKWWPGGQPHLEGGDGAEAAPEEAAEGEPETQEQPAAVEPAEEQPAAAEQPATEAPAEQPATEAPAEQPAAQSDAAPASQADPEYVTPAAPAAPAGTSAAPVGTVAAPAAAIATEPEHRQVAGVTHGTPTGNRLRPEDGVSTEAQFEGQRAMYERRKLIDELVATGVPAASAADSGRPRAPWLAILYLIIPLLVVGFIVTNSEDAEPAAEPAPQETDSGGGDTGGGGAVALVAEGLAFDLQTIEVTAGDPAPVELDNQDTTVHNFVIFDNPKEASGEELFTSPDVDAGSAESFEIDPLDKGEYFFHCGYHPQMAGTVVSS